MRYLTTAAVVLAPWGLLAAWQRHEYVNERDLMRQTLVRQADSLMNSLVSGIRSHRWLGPFIREQLPATLQQLAQSPDVLAVAVAPLEGEGKPMAAGEAALMDDDRPPGRYWDERSYVLVTAFQLAPDAVGGAGQRGAGRAGGWGRKLGRPSTDDVEPLAATRFKAILALDNTAVQAQCRSAAWNRGFVVLAGGLLLAAMVFIWQARVRLLQARARARLLEAETRHLRELGQAAAGLAHETRNPLGLVRGRAQRLADTPLPPDQQQQVTAILEECDRITSRINQFLAFARPQPPRLEAVDVTKLVDELAVLLEPDLETRRLMLRRHGLAAGQTVRADREMLRQALFNLLQNAIQFAPEGGMVSVAIGPERGRRRYLDVIDNGPGVTEEARDSLFTPYFTTRPGGTGLGLAIVRRIAIVHGWQVAYRPRPGGGSVFRLSGIHG